ncbi:helix-turn-helix transcriptional regulator [Quatrionicoccus australiensis]|uniref:helix-turn-helix transcriptional regulator n=1 Tax=Quatrionicoccus australiensis TaxID=138118 RepID=UPI001CF7FCCA|nr:helix-turn-helix domain-containing protein [Quatrionicoccus australiensis]UCV14125.1 helix-turn-helix domain-containing protein [Quatrionicoccus australiensis]
MTHSTILSAISGMPTVRETCEFLKIGRTSFYALVKAGKLETVKLGARSTRVKRESLEKLVANGIA